MNLCRVKASFSLDWAVTETNADCWLDSSSFGWVHMKTQGVVPQSEEEVEPLPKTRALLPFIRASPWSPFLPYLPSTRRILRRFFNSTCVTSPVSPPSSQGLMEQLLFSSRLFWTSINSGLSGLTPSVVLPYRSRWNNTSILRTATLQALVRLFVCLVFCLFLIFWRCQPASAHVSGHSQIDLTGSRIRCLLKITTSYFVRMIVFWVGMKYSLKFTGKWNVASLYFQSCRHKVELQLSCSPFFALLCSSHLVKNSPRGISLDWALPLSNYRFFFF